MSRSPLFITPSKPPTRQERPVRALTQAEQERVAQRKLEALVAQFERPARPNKPKKTAVVATFHVERVDGNVDWSKQDRRFDQVRTSGKAKKADGKKRGD